MAGIHIHGSVTGQRTSPVIEITDLSSVIAIDGVLTDVNSTGPEITVARITQSVDPITDVAQRGAIAIDADANGLDEPSGAGADDAAWRNGATIAVGIGAEAVTYARDQGNTQSARIWNIRDCAADLNSDGVIDAADATLFNLALTSPGGQQGYDFLWAGLCFSRAKHGDANFSGGFTADDLDAFTNLVANTCCLKQAPSAQCPGDVGMPDPGTGLCVFDYGVNINDLGRLLSGFGTTNGATRCQGDLTGNGIVDISDLSELLAHFGTTCCPSAPPPAPLQSGITTTVQPYNTGGYKGGDFYGEQTHFVFDVLVQMLNTADDWTGGGVAVTSANGTTFRLVTGGGNPPVPGNATPAKYATFFSVPFANVNGNNRFIAPFPTGGIAGRYTGSGGFVYTDTSINAAWYDMNANSHDGPAAVLRLVLDVTNVAEANTSAGLGSVYFSTNGPASAGHIKVADLTFEPEHKHAEAGSLVISGSFYVTN